MTRLFATIAALSALLLALAAPASAQPESLCPGVHVLIAVEYLQSGFAGRTGERTTIGEDGCYVVEFVLNGEAAGRVRSGQLGPRLTASMRAAIEAADIMSWPDRSGAPGSINPALLSISYKGVTKTVVAPAGTGIDGMTAIGDGAPARLAARLLELIAPG